MLGDGHVRNDGPTKSGRVRRDHRSFAQLDQGRIDGFQMLCAMLGIRTHSRWNEHCGGYQITAYHRGNFRPGTIAYKEEEYDGHVWCPSVPNKTFFARRNGVTYWTGNTELWTEEAMQAFINDEMVLSQPNPLGVIPFVHIPNTKVPSSPWGLADIADVVDLNRNYNEIATLIADIIDYYASPVTVVTGAKSNQLERGPNKVWALLNDKAKVQNLAMNTDLASPIGFLQLIKEGMHELVGIPVNALGQDMAISNTSGVALALQLLPLMQKFFQKRIQYESGVQRLNELILRAVAYYLPEMLVLDPTRDAPLEEGQLDRLDPRDPLTYRNTVEFASPLPLDKLIALNEITAKMQLGLESKEGALRILGEAFPREKLEELLNEMHEDMLEQGALDLLRAQINDFIAMMTGQVPGPDGQPVPAGAPAAGGPTVQSAGGPGVNSGGQGASMTMPTINMDDPDLKNIFTRLNTIMAGTKIPQVRNPGKADDD